MKLDYVQTLNALEAFPHGKEFVRAVRLLAGEITMTQKTEYAGYAARILVAAMPLESRELDGVFHALNHHSQR